MPSRISEMVQFKALDCCDYQALIGVSQPVMEWQSHQAIADILGDRAIARLAAHFTTHFRSVQWQIMENADDALYSEVGDQCLAGF